MLIAEKRRKENIAEYLLYMWQVEDIIRANNLDIDEIQKNIIEGFSESEEKKKEIRQWYSNLIDMMRSENVTEKGHLQINKNIVINLTELHQALLNSDKYPEYKTIYYKTLPFIVELRAKGADKEQSEIETCFDALYGFLLLKLQHINVSGETQAAISQISSMIRYLSQKYKEEKEGMLEL